MGFDTVLKTENKIRFFFLALIFIALLAALIPAAFADDKCYGKKCDDPVSQAVSQVVAGDSLKSYAFGMGGPGDVAIQDCLASTQWGVIGFYRQKVGLNRWCAAEAYDQKGMAHMAAVMRCGITDVRAYFESDKACHEANTYVPRETSPEPDLVKEFNYAEQHLEIEHIQQEQASLVGQIEQLSVALTSRQPAVVRRDRYSDEQKAAVWAAFEHDKDE